MGGREAPAVCIWPGEQGLAACEQSPHQVVFTVAKFRPPGPRLLGLCRFACLCHCLGLPGLCLPCLLS